MTIWENSYWNVYITICEMTSQFAVWCREPKATAPWQLRGWVGERQKDMRGGFKRDGIYTYLWPMRVYVRQCVMMGCHFLLQGIFPTQDWTLVSYTADRFFTPEPQGKPLTHTYLWPMRVDVWRKPSQNCKVITL